MLDLCDLYRSNCQAASVDPNEGFIDQIQECVTKCRASLDFHLDGGEKYEKLEDRDFSVILDTLKKGGCIHSICVPGNNLTDIIIPGIAQLISQSDSINEIDLSGNQITSDGIKSLQDALSQSQSLTHVNLANNAIGDDGCLLVIFSLRVNRTITHVNLSSTRMSQNSMTVLGAIIGQINRLKCLYVDNPHPSIDGDSSAKRLLLSLKNNQSLYELSMAHAKLGDDSAFHIANALKFNKVLTKIRLRGNHISSVGAQELAEALSTNTTLEVLDISGNSIGDIGAESFSRMLAENRKLQRLDLSYNGIKGVGLSALCRSFQANSTLCEIALWGNSIIDHSVMVEFSQLKESARGANVILDFDVHFSNDEEPIPYTARTDEENSPHIWV